MWCVGSVVAAPGLSCFEACGIPVSQAGTELTSPALQGRFLTTGPPGKSSLPTFFFFYANIKWSFILDDVVRYLGSDNKEKHPSSPIFEIIYFSFVSFFIIILKLYFKLEDCSLFNQVVSMLLSCRHSFYILDVNPLSDIICKYFSHSETCLFTLLTIVL